MKWHDHCYLLSAPEQHTQGARPLANRPFWQQTPEERQALLDRLRARLDVPLAVLALLWVIVIVVDLTRIIPAVLLPVVQSLDLGIWAFFLAEFLLELAIAPHKIDYLADNWVVGLSVLLPFFGILRVVRAVSALRSLSLLRVVLGANRATRGASEILGRGGFQYVVAIVLVTVLVGAAAVSFFEQPVAESELRTFPEALWWAATLVTTINIGASPITTEGRVIAMLLRLVGLAVFSYLTGSIASYLVGGDTNAPSGPAPAERETLEAIRSELAQLNARLQPPDEPADGGDDRAGGD